jgi:hypothetical protein
VAVPNVLADERRLEPQDPEHARRQPARPLNLQHTTTDLRGRRRMQYDADAVRIDETDLGQVEHDRRRRIPVCSPQQLA